MKNEVKELKRHLEILSEKIRKHFRILSSLSVSSLTVTSHLESKSRIRHSPTSWMNLILIIPPSPPHLSIFLSKNGTKKLMFLLYLYLYALCLKSYWEKQHYPEDVNRNKHSCNINLRTVIGKVYEKHNPFLTFTSKGLTHLFPTHTFSTPLKY